MTESISNDGKIDPVCGMDLIELPGLAKSSYLGKTFFFCGDKCLERFQNNPEKFQKAPLIKLSKVQKVFKIGEVETRALNGFDLHIWEGDFVVIIGASGSGKSTVLNMIGMLDQPTSGAIFLRGQNIALLDDEARAEMRSKTFGFVFQQYNLIPWLAADENVALPAIFAGKKIKEGELESRFQEIGLKERMRHRSFELSGGEQQRTALLRALINDPEIILGDEPTGNLDSTTGNKILEMLINLNKNYGKTLVVVTHDADIANKSDQIIVVKDGRAVRDHRVHKKIYTE